MENILQEEEEEEYERVYLYKKSILFHAVVLGYIYIYTVDVFISFFLYIHLLQHSQTIWEILFFLTNSEKRE